jgi:hypothetical protein
MFDSSLSGNTALVEGGGLHLGHGVATATLTGVTISGNQAINPQTGTGRGGGFDMFLGSNLTLTNCQIIDNLADIVTTNGGEVRPFCTYVAIGCIFGTVPPQAVLGG